MRLPNELETERLYIRRPQMSDAEAIYERYGGDPEVTRYLTWPPYRSPDDTRSFLVTSERGWANQTVLPYLVFSRDRQLLLGSSGLEFETPFRAMTGYVFARDAWGKGYATEVTRAMAELAFRVPGFRRIYAVCHVTHAVSARVLEKCGFEREGVLRRYVAFPNLDPPGPQDVYCYSQVR